MLKSKSEQLRDHFETENTMQIYLLSRCNEYEKNLREISMKPTNSTMVILDDI